MPRVAHSVRRIPPRSGRPRILPAGRATDTRALRPAGRPRQPVHRQHSRVPTTIEIATAQPPQGPGPSAVQPVGLSWDVVQVTDAIQSMPSARHLRGTGDLLSFFLNWRVWSTPRNSA